ncbi:MAG: DUF418 domain-containing protein [bacterium]|nr:DUF418 domain-containing protein [bacterium]
MSGESDTVVRGPTPPGERIAVVDELRGFAVLGILVVNMTVFKSASAYTPTAVGEWTGGLDRFVSDLILFAATGKFYLLFTFLFGLGFHLQLERAEARRVAFEGRFVRRMAVLLLIGLAHALLLWSGDILTKYALAGVLLLLFRRLGPRALVAWAVTLAITAFLLSGSVTQEAGRQAEELKAVAAEVYGTGSYLEIRHFARMEIEYIFRPLPLLVLLGVILSYFLVGLAVGRTGLFQEPEKHFDRLRRLMPWLLGAGLLGNLVMLMALRGAEPGELSPRLLLGSLALLVSGPSLTASYVCGMILLFQRARWRRVLQPLAAVGRMALTNYLLQSLVCTTLFYGYGLGLYGKVGPAQGLGICLVVFALQALFSTAWLRWFRFGPVEWVWRTAIYGVKP